MSAYGHVSTAAARLAQARATLPPGALELACHAAVPVAVDPTLLHLLRINFFVDPPHDLPWTVEAALLTSPLFRDLGGGLYEIDDDLRRHLLISLRTAYPPDRTVQVALLLERYCDRPDVWSAHPFLAQAQQLTAIGIIDPPAASRWLSDAAADSGVQVGLSKDWFVAMRGRLDRQPDPSRSLTDEIQDEIDRLPSDAAVRRLAELGLLPGADVDLIRAELRTVTSEAAAGALAVLGPLPDVDVVAFDAAAGPMPLTDLLGMPFPQRFDPVRQWAPRTGLSIPFGVDAGGVPVLLDFDMPGLGLLTAVDGGGRRELLRTIVLALAATAHPDQLHLLLIDGNVAKTLESLSSLPHVVGFHRGPATPIGARHLMSDIDRYLERRAGAGSGAQPRLVVVVDEFENLSRHSSRFAPLLAIGRHPGVHVLLASRVDPTMLRNPGGSIPDWRIDLGSATTPGHGTLSADGQRRDFAAAATFVWRGPDGNETVLQWLTASLVAGHAPNAWVTVPTPDRRPALFDLIGTPRQVPGRGLAAGGSSVYAVLGIVSSPDGLDYAPLRVDLADGNLAVVGSSAVATTDVLLAAVLSLALTRTPQEAHFVLIDGSGGLSPLAGLPHVRLVADGNLAMESMDAVDLVLDLVTRRAASTTDEPEARVFLVIDDWNGAKLDRTRLAAIAGDGPGQRVHLLASARTWTVSTILQQFANKIELALDDPPGSVIDPARAAELSLERVDTGLVAGGRYFIPALVGEDGFSNAAAAEALAARIADGWDGPVARDLWIPEIAPRNYYFISHVDGGPSTYGRRLHIDLSAEVRVLAGVTYDVEVGTAVFALPAGTAGAARIEETLSVCQMFIGVDGAGYFDDPACAQQWNLFHTRDGAAAAVRVVTEELDGVRHHALVSRLAEEIVANARAQPVPEAKPARRLAEMPAIFPLPGPRRALVIGTSKYRDRKLVDLPDALLHAAALAGVLGDPGLGGFTVSTLFDRGTYEFQLTVTEFLTSREPDDHVLLYLAGLSLRDIRGQRVFATIDTDSERLPESGIELAWLIRQLNNCRARRQIVIVDCCTELRSEHLYELEPLLDPMPSGSSRTVLTSTYLRGRPSSTFTAALVEGLRTGDADSDGDGRIAADEAFQYALSKVRDIGLVTTPSMSVYGSMEKFVLAKTARRSRRLG
ncbi:FtsK/SpoIIIE domain-containing protein [Dactylosporangium cerinum]|uniref:FtsK/SpoIIIE domain-containing protein n=1 Tax=Dactylosporangium cerinum TaxID=1434730 RepID=A0ABV9W6L4_9ACTN